MTIRIAFRLKVKQIHQSCSFELSWGEGQELSAQLDYPASLTTKYQAWQSAYVDGYKNLQRGRVVKNVGINLPPEYWHSRLVKAESELLHEFYQWLRNAALFEIRTKIAGATKEHDQVEVFLTCDSLELRRLPWETWEIGSEAVGPGTIRIARTPSNIRHEPPQPRRGRARILVIVGYDEQLDFKKDRQAVQRILNGAAEVKFICLQPGQEPAKLKTQICEAIADERGWDMLFFIGHSNEAHLMGGELGIAPGVFLSIKEIEQPLTEAKKRGLQFAVFNSCSGLDIAKSLISIGLSQVAVMREPIHNQVAQEFLVRFLQVLAEYRDVHDALLEACQYLKLKKHFTYPSAYLIPSLFCHPDAELFCLKPSGFWQGFKRWQPTRGEAIAFSSVLLLSLMIPVQELLLDSRTLVQAIYRHTTKQLPRDKPPPVLLVAIDQESIYEADKEIENFEVMPMDREYLARLVARLSELEFPAIGIDYFLDTTENKAKEEKLADSIRDSVEKQNTWFVFANSEKFRLLDQVIKDEWSLQGDTSLFPWDISLPTDETCPEDSCPFAYLLALSQILSQQPVEAGVPKPELQSKIKFQRQLSQYLERKDGQNKAIALLKQVNSPLELRTIIDFSLPPNQVYEYISAKDFLNPSFPKAENKQRLKQQVAIIASGGYSKAMDNFSVPLAIDYWCYFRKVLKHQMTEIKGKIFAKEFTGGEAHAYMVHHWISQHQVLLIPNILIIIVAKIMGKWMTLIMLNQDYKQRHRLLVILLCSTAVYGAIGLQVYVSAKVLIPWFLPSVMFGLYVILVFRRNCGA